MNSIAVEENELYYLSLAKLKQDTSLRILRYVEAEKPIARMETLYNLLRLVPFKPEGYTFLISYLDALIVDAHSASTSNSQRGAFYRDIRYFSNVLQLLNQEIAENGNLLSQSTVASIYRNIFKIATQVIRVQLFSISVP